MKNFTNKLMNNILLKPTRWLLVTLMFLLGTSGAWADRTLYLDLSGFSGWGGAKYSVNYFGGSGVTQKFTGFATTTTINGKSYYKVTGIPDAATTIIWVRHNSSASTPTWDNKWNQTQDLTISGANGKNVVKITDWNTGSWSETVSECKTASLSWSTIATSMNVGENQTISATLTAGAGSVTYTSSNTSVITVSGSKLTAVGNGTATITATHSTVTSGYCTANSITKNITVSTSIPSGTKLYFDFSKATTWGTGHYLSIVASTNSSHYANNSHTDGVGQGNYKPKSDATWVALTKECDGIYSYTTTSDITTGISLWAADLSTYDDVWQTDVILNITAADFDKTKTCYTLGSTSTRHNERQTDCFGGSWGSIIPVCCTPVEASHYTITTTEYTYDGTAKKPTVSANTAAGAPTSTVYKQGNTEVENPTNVGTYDVYVSSNDGTTYCGANNLKVGSFEIKCKEGTASSLYTLTAIEFEYNGAPRQPGINVATGAGTVASIVYKQGNTVVASPINVGSYDVYITSNAGTGYCAITTLTKIGSYEIKCRTATASQYTISSTSYTYDGSAKKPTVSKASGAGAAGEVTDTVYKQGNTTVDNPINAGTYDIYITTEAGTGYCALTNFKLGSFTINGKDPVESDFTYTNSKDYTGSALSADVAWKNNLAAGVGGAITTYYKVEGAADNTYTTTAPTAVGTYTVAVTTTPGGNYKATTEKIELGTFTINEVCEDPSNIVFTINSPQSTYYLGDKVAATLNYDGTEVDGGHSWTYNSTEIGISGPAPKKGASFTFTLKKVTNSTDDITIKLPKCSSGEVESSPLNFAITALPAPTDATASVTGNTANLLWTPGVRDSVLIVRYAKGATTTAPTANTKYIVGNEIGNGMVVYKGIGTSFSNSGLTYGNAYDYYFYTVNNNYYSTTNNPKATVTVCPTAITGADNLFVNKTSEYTINATTEATYSWSIDTETDATIAGSGNTATVTAGATAGNATISVTINGGNCDGITLTKDITIKDGIVIYIRRPKSGDGTSVYSNWYNESSVKGGLPWVKPGPISGSNSNNQATTNNTGGTELTEAFTDCDGYTWDSFTPADSWSSFYLHALNDYKQDGWATFTKAINFDKSTDNYFYLSGWSSGNYGVTITKTNAPALGITIAALGSTEVISNNMASFAALYLKGNCSGKELKTDSEGDFTDQTFLWQYSTDGTSWSTYTGGDGATWNNIRPTQAGKYKLICTMEDDSPIESNIIEITTTTESYDADDLINITSNLPIFMVNTGGKGFPSCVNASDFPTKHADALKKKRSVDVKIKVGNDIVYDRKARMNYRGSSSLNFKKKSYAFSSGQEYCGLDKDESPDYMKKGKMDMFSVITKGGKTSSEEKDWVLYAANPDPSMMRNILAMETFSAMTGKWGVKNQYVELYVDGEYQGVYVFMDKITQNMGKDDVDNDGRVEVKWKVDGSSKGFIVKFDKTDVADRYEDATGDQKTFESDLTGASGIGTYGTQVDQRFEIEYPEKGDIEDDGGSWAEVKGFIEAKVNAFESALKDGKFNEVRNMIDYESWADFFIINEFVKNVDAYRASCIFVYEDNKLKAYPLWDYELSFNNQAIGSGKGKADPTGLLIEHDDVYSDAFAAPFWWTGRYSNHIYKGLLDDPCFVSMIKTRWDMHANGEGALTQSKLQDLVDSYTTALTTTDATDTYNSPKARETKKWPYTYDSRGKADCNSDNTGYYAGWTSDKCEADMNALTTWIGSGNTGRRDNLDGIIEEMASDISFSLSVVSDKSTTTPWRPVIITVSSNSGYEYTITPEAAQVKDNGNQHTIYLARPEGTEGTNFATQTDAYTFTATSGETDQCGSSEPVSQSVKITLEDIEENCP